MRSRRKKAPGFTLIEVVVAMAILSIGLVVIIELFGGGLRLGRVSEEYTKAAGYARIKIEEISLDKSLAEGVYQGEFDSNYRWQVEVKRVDLIPPGKDITYRPSVALYRVRIDVLWRSGLKDRVASIESYRLLKEEESGQKT
ncbi:MAG TPA: type II secretion system protein [Thermodesulfobacteriota bacterium]|nr:type II secretion system protein [Thermodesulfobacteriota bacterium]